MKVPGVRCLVSGVRELRCYILTPPMKHSKFVWERFLTAIKIDRIP